MLDGITLLLKLLDDIGDTGYVDLWHQYLAKRMVRCEHIRPPSGREATKKRSAEASRRVNTPPSLRRNDVLQRSREAVPAKGIFTNRRRIPAPELPKVRPRFPFIAANRALRARAPFSNVFVDYLIKLTDELGRNVAAQLPVGRFHCSVRRPMRRHSDPTDARFGRSRRSRR